MQYVFGLARNERLVAQIRPELEALTNSHAAEITLASVPSQVGRPKISPNMILVLYGSQVALLN